jgi:hypothetical protein
MKVMYTSNVDFGQHCSSPEPQQAAAAVEKPYSPVSPKRVAHRPPPHHHPPPTWSTEKVKGILGYVIQSPSSIDSSPSQPSPPAAPPPIPVGINGAGKGILGFRTLPPANLYAFEDLAIKEETPPDDDEAAYYHLLERELAATIIQCFVRRIYIEYFLRIKTKGRESRLNASSGSLITSIEDDEGELAGIDSEQDRSIESDKQNNRAAYDAYVRDTVAYNEAIEIRNRGNVYLDDDSDYYDDQEDGDDILVKLRLERLRLNRVERDREVAAILDCRSRIKRLEDKENKAEVREEEVDQVNDDSMYSIDESTIPRPETTPSKSAEAPSLPDSASKLQRAWRSKMGHETMKLEIVESIRGITI